MTAYGYIFDMDGCLLDSIKIWHEAEQRVMDEASVELTKEQRDHLNALTLEEAGEFFHREFGIGASGSTVVQAIVGHMLEFYNNEVEPNPGVVEFVSALAAQGVPMCVLSSSPQSFLQAGLSHADLLKYFPRELVISAEDEGLTKRNPDTFTYVCDKLGTAPENTWLFDDSWYALATAHGVGLKTIGVFSTDGCGTHEELAAHSNKVIDDFTELSAADFIGR